MMTGDADKRGQAWQSAGIGGREPPAAGPSPIDWGKLRDEVLRMFDGAGVRDKERAIGSASVADAVQIVIAELYARFEAGEEPRTHEELMALAEQDVRRQLSSWWRREKRRSVQLDAYAASFSARDLFDFICRRDEQTKFFARMYEAVEKDPEAKQVLILVLEKGVPFGATRVLAKLLVCSAAEVTNTKRRLVRMGGKILKELSEPNPKGDGQ